MLNECVVFFNFFTLRVCDCKKPECKEMKPCIIGMADMCGETGFCAKKKYCLSDRNGNKYYQDIIPWPFHNGCCLFISTGDMKCS